MLLKHNTYVVPTAKEYMELDRIPSRKHNIIRIV